jgi:membrane protein implicated in regulation of membrane protease activity
MEKKLFTFKGSTIPIEKFFPENLTMVLAFSLAFGAAGMGMTLLGLYWFFVLPFAIMTGMVLCFVIQEALRRAVEKNTDKTPPEGDTAANVEGFVVEEIDGDDYGLIEFEFNGVTFRANALSANETPIPEYERVIILFEENGFYFVQSIREVFLPLNEEQE